MNFQFIEESLNEALTKYGSKLLDMRVSDLGIEFGFDVFSVRHIDELHSACSLSRRNGRDGDFDYYLSPIIYQAFNIYTYKNIHSVCSNEGCQMLWYRKIFSKDTFSYLIAILRAVRFHPSTGDTILKINNRIRDEFLEWENVKAITGMKSDVWKWTQVNIACWLTRNLRYSKYAEDFIYIRDGLELVGLNHCDLLRMGVMIIDAGDLYNDIQHLKEEIPKK